MSDKLEKILAEFKVPKPSDDFADRIIMASCRIEQKQNIWKLLGRICEEFKLPDPAVAMASLLVIGFLVGFSAYDYQSGYSSAGDTVEQLLSDDEELL